MTRKKTDNYLGRDLNKEREPDKISEQRRSYVMSKVRSKGTKFENDFIEQLKKRTKKKYRLNVKEIKGKPDIMFPGDKVCVFLDSDFWHGWQFPRWKHLLKNDFWRNKIEKNRDRDRKNTLWLRRRNWNVLRIWEHNINKNVHKEIDKILKVINKKH